MLFSVDEPGRRNGGIIVVNSIMRLTIATVAFALAVCFNIPASRASFGNAPWCVMRFGDEIYWDCQYRTSQECLASMASGNRGSCNVNPSTGPSTPTAVARPEHRRRHPQRH